jgi:uncharacterized membrane protein YoaK (UPF0700 family)
MKLSIEIVYASVCLSFAGGFSDAVTFVVVLDIFSAHVTGNFIELSKDLIFGAHLNGWLKLLVFPVFILAVMTGGIMRSCYYKPSTVLYAEGMILITCGLLGMLNVLHFGSNPSFNYLLALGIVFAMGLQNAFGKFYSKHLQSSTTVMTGNVTQFALDLAGCLFARSSGSRDLESLKCNSWVILGFLAGALAGTIGAKIIGITAIILPSIAVLHLSFKGVFWETLTQNYSQSPSLTLEHKIKA